MKPAAILLSAIILLLTLCGCSGSHYRLVSKEYGFSVDFPEKPIEQSLTNSQGLPKILWSVLSDDPKEFYSAEATNYKEAPNYTQDWVPNKELLAVVGVETLEHHRFKLRARATGREVDAIATTSKQVATGDIFASIYVLDGRKLISITSTAPLQ